jgi:BolA family transcriptional regulator, general stress-responsive regulator
MHPTDPLNASQTPAPKVSAQAIHERLQAALQPVALEVQDDSHLHAGHAGAREGGHYTVRICSARFAGLSRPARHRLVYDHLSPWMSSGIHALAIQASVPDDAAPAA